MNAPLMHALEQERIVFKLNGREVDAFAGETIIEAADRLGVAIPRLCYKPGMRPDGNCRACMVEIKGERLLAPSCCRRPGAGMEVESDSARALHAQKMIIEMPSGITDQTISSTAPSAGGGGGGSESDRRRYLMAKTITRVAMRSEKKTEMAIRKK